MPDLRVKRIYEPIEPADGFRVLVDRLWPRGVSKDEAGVDHWAKGLAPSTPLRRWFQHDPERFEEFRARYLEELHSGRHFEQEVEVLGGRPVVTLLYAASDTQVNHAVVLREFLFLRLDE